MSDMDLQSLLSSEVFKIFAEIEAKRENDEKIKIAEIEKDLFNKFSEIENTIKSNNKLKKAFKKEQVKLRKDAEYRDKADPGFVRGILMLDLD